MSDPYAFASEEQFDRHARAVRNVERMTHGDGTSILPQGLPTGHNQVIVQITGPPVDGVYPTLMRFINLDASGDVGVWYDGEEGRARELNDGALKVGERYICMVVGVKDGFAVAECYGTPGSRTSTTKPPCTGTCQWHLNTTTDKWQLVTWDCLQGCICDPPLYCPPPGETCGDINTPCVRGSAAHQPLPCIDYGGGGGGAGGCGHIPPTCPEAWYCTYNPNAPWQRICFCSCIPPPFGYFCEEDSETACMDNWCGEFDPDTDPCSGTCTYNHAGVLVASNCDGCFNCQCLSYTGSPPFNVCQFVTQNCSPTGTSTTTTSTTPDPTTTTTHPPCGCFYQCVRGGFGGGVRSQWILVNQRCHPQDPTCDGAGCDRPIDGPCVLGSSYSSDCHGTFITTTTTTSTTTVPSSTLDS